MPARLEVRLDDERKQRLEELGEAEGVPISEVVRRLIDDAWEEVMRARRIAAVERMAQLEVEDPPDPETLSRELEETYEPGGLS
ncbi:MAG: ribbon-helix-helix protein, CopG family [Chloroflexota bacterium]|nr:ribbon-helix-helix protein, CopG family [Chloroflexota bacterium]